MLFTAQVAVGCLAHLVHLTRPGREPVTVLTRPRDFSSSLGTDLFKCFALLQSLCVQLRGAIGVQLVRRKVAIERCELWIRAEYRRVGKRQHVKRHLVDFVNIPNEGNYCFELAVRWMRVAASALGVERGKERSKPVQFQQMHTLCETTHELFTLKALHDPWKVILLASCKSILTPSVIWAATQADYTHDWEFKFSGEQSGGTTNNCAKQEKRRRSR